jgi:hypothetical protein
LKEEQGEKRAQALSPWSADIILLFVHGSFIPVMNPAGFNGKSGGKGLSRDQGVVCTSIFPLDVKHSRFDAAYILKEIADHSEIHYTTVIKKRGLRVLSQPDVSGPVSTLDAIQIKP